MDYRYKIVRYKMEVTLAPTAVLSLTRAVNVTLNDNLPVQLALKLPPDSQSEISNNVDVSFRAEVVSTKPAEDINYCSLVRETSTPFLPASQNLEQPSKVEQHGANIPEYETCNSNNRDIQSVKLELPVVDKRKDNSPEYMEVICREKTRADQSLLTGNKSHQLIGACAASNSNNVKASIGAKNSVDELHKAASEVLSHHTEEETPRPYLPNPYTRRNSTDILLEEARQAYLIRTQKTLQQTDTHYKRELSSPIDTDSSSDTNSDTSCSTYSAFDYSDHTEDSIPRHVIPKLYDNLENIEIPERRRKTPEGVADLYYEQDRHEDKTVKERVPSFIDFSS